MLSKTRQYHHKIKELLFRDVMVFALNARVTFSKLLQKNLRKDVHVLPFIPPLQIRIALKAGIGGTLSN